METELFEMLNTENKLNEINRQLNGLIDYFLAKEEENEKKSNDNTESQEVSDTEVKKDEKKDTP